MGVQVVYPKPKEARSFRKRAVTCNVHFIPSVLMADQSMVNHTIWKHTLTQKWKEPLTPCETSENDRVRAETETYIFHYLLGMNWNFKSHLLPLAYHCPIQAPGSNAHPDGKKAHSCMWPGGCVRASVYTHTLIQKSAHKRHTCLETHPSQGTDGRQVADSQQGR